ncbi:MAG: hypothetical protein KF761_02175 [Salinibacterium sp.]|nr:hypothetical protein [Salinibacterium sp.]
MAWFRRSRRRINLGTFIAPADLPPASMDELLDEGELISTAAVRLAIKNRIIMGALRDDLSFDEPRYAAAVADELGALADERDADAERIARDRLGAEGRTGRAEHFHDYRGGDSRRLARREDYSRRLAMRLRDLAGDEQFAHGVAQRAQAAAWDEIAASVQANLARAATIADEPDYVIERIDRLRELSKDLIRLEKDSRPD